LSEAFEKSSRFWAICAFLQDYKPPICAFLQDFWGFGGPGAEAGPEG